MEKCFMKKSHYKLLLGHWYTQDLKYINEFMLPIISLTTFELSNLRKYKMLPMSTEITKIFFERKNYPMAAVGIKTSSTTGLQKILEGFKNSIWWNHEASVLIFNENNCDSPYLFIDLVWNINLLNVMYLCYESNKQLSIYSFNPYSRSTSKFWDIMSESTDRITLLKLKTKIFDPSRTMG